MDEARAHVTISLTGCVVRPAETCERLCGLLEGRRGELVLCDVCAASADAATVDTLARLELAARRRGLRLKLRSSSPELRGLIELMGLSGVLQEWL